MGSSAVIGIISGVVASIIVFLVLLLIRPKVIISSDICRGDNDLCRIKVVNCTRAILTNLKYTLQCFTTRGDGIFDTTNIKPEKEPLIFIDKYDKDDEDASYAIRFSYKIPASCYLNDGHTKLVFTFLANHAYSNTSICIQREYTYNNIVHGIFETGKSTKIIRTNNMV
jgi:hypothetical protein